MKPSAEHQPLQRTARYSSETVPISNTVEEAIEIIGNGRIQYYAVLASALCLMNYVVDVLGISLIIPAATCDLQLTTHRKGLLISVPFLGLTLTAHLWGFLADSIGRRKSILLSLGSSIVFSCLSALAPEYWIMLVSRFLSGMCFAGASSTMYPYLSEMLPERSRSKLMILIGYALAVGMFVMSAVGWTLLHYFSEIPLTKMHAITPWRTQMIVLLIPGAIGAYLYYILPESPKFLVSIGDTEQAMDVLKRMHEKSPNRLKDFPIGALTVENVHPKSQQMSVMLRNIWKETRTLFQKPYLWPMVGSCFIAYGLFTVGAGLLMWFPEITNRLKGGIPGGTVCHIFSHPIQSVPKDLALIEVVDWSGCFVEVQDKIYWDNMAIGVGYLLSNTVFYLFTKKFKLLHILIICMLVSSASAFVLPSLSNEWAILICFTLLLTGASSGIHIFNVLVVEIFPNSLCGMALSLASLAGRAGTFIGANELGVLLESKCEVAIYGIAFLIAACVVCAALLPKKM